jgi:proteasome lid subunit RPN8/RPN11
MLRLQKAIVAEILAHAEAGAPHEVVGLVWADAQGVQMVEQLRNTHADPERYYNTDPAEILSAYRRMEAAGGLPVAFYHSHPSGRADPSETDMQGAMNAGLHYLIAYPEAIVDEAQRKPGYVRQWILSAWQCVEMHLLLEDTYEVTP